MMFLFVSNFVPTGHSTFSRSAAKVNNSSFSPIVAPIYIRKTSFYNKTMGSTTSNTQSSSATTTSASLHDITFNDIKGSPIDFSKFAGKLVLAVNVACQCGYTRSGYETMKNLANKYKNDLVVLAFPSNEFGRQEPGSPQEIQDFVNQYFGTDNGVTIMEKSSVKSSTANPVFALAKQSGGGEPSWNFDGRLLFGKQGQFIKRFDNGSSTSDIEKAIKENM